MTNIDIYNSLSNDLVRKKEINVLNKKIKRINDSLDRELKWIFPFNWNCDYSIDDRDLNSDITDYIFGNSHKYMNKVKIKNMPNINLKVNNYYL